MPSLALTCHLRGWRLPAALGLGCLLAAAAGAQEQFREAAAALGGNVPGLRPNYTGTDFKKLTSALDGLPEGAKVRFGTIFWETFWDSKTKGNYRGIDACLAEFAKRKLVPVALIQPSPHPSCKTWYPSGHNDWWQPKAELFRSTTGKSDISRSVTELVRHIEALALRLKLDPPYYQIANEPAGKLLNPPMGEKPGGSNQTKLGEWHKDSHEFFWRIGEAIFAAQVPKSRIVSPAISGFGEPRFAMELISVSNLKKWNWRNWCGNLAYNWGPSCGWQTSFEDRLKWFREDSLSQLLKVHAAFAKPDQRLWVTELYLTPGRCGLELDANLDPYRGPLAQMLKSHSIETMVWGLAEIEHDGPRPTKWDSYGGWGRWLMRQRSEID